MQELLLVHGGCLALLAQLLWQCLVSQRQSALSQAVVCKRRGHPCNAVGVFTVLIVEQC